MAARFALFTGDLREALKCVQKIRGNGGGRGGAVMESALPTTAFEIEAFVIEKWCELLDVENTLNSYDDPMSSDLKKRLQTLDSTFADIAASGPAGVDLLDPDALLLWARCKQLLGVDQQAGSRQATGFVVNVLNQVGVNTAIALCMI